MRFNGVFQHHPRTRATSRDGASLPPPPPKLPSSMECPVKRCRGGGAHKRFPRFSDFIGAFLIFFAFFCQVPGCGQGGSKLFPKNKQKERRKTENGNQTILRQPCVSLFAAVASPPPTRGGVGDRNLVGPRGHCLAHFGWVAVQCIFSHSVKLKHPPSPTLTL